MLYFELIFVLLLTILNGVLAMSELAVMSSRRSRLESLSKLGDRRAAMALRLLDDPSRFLSTVQIGITLVGIFAGAFSGATLGLRLGQWLDTFPIFEPYGASFGVGITVVLITYLSLIVGELVPKRIALVNPESVASIIAGPMWALSQLAAPAVWLLDLSSSAVLSLLRLSDSPGSTITEDEIKSLIAEGTESGVFAPQERDLIDGVLRLADRPVRVIMTPRAEIVRLDKSATPEEVSETFANTERCSRVLVCEGSIDNPLGVVHTKNLLPDALRGEKLDLLKHMTPLLFVHDRTPVLKLLEKFKLEKTHIAVVVDEYGVTEGLVTLTDVLESIVGSLPEHDEEEGPQLQQRADGSWLVDAMLPMDEFEHSTGLAPVTGPRSDTLAGFILGQLGHLPKAGDVFDVNGYRFEVVDMDGLRIDKVIVSPPQTTSQPTPPQQITPQGENPEITPVP